LKWTSSPVVTTALQVFSRVFVLYWINVIPADRQIELLDISGITIVSLAWGVTEVVRYNYYFFTLLNKPLQVLHYLRYTLFIILYPLGITGEGMIMLSALKVNEWQISLTNGIIVIVLLSYIPFFPKLYGYMWKQRRKKLQ
jgi:very-long-chain (3R)-3-hydroxyacyl-CoA dehydratase